MVGKNRLLRRVMGWRMGLLACVAAYLMWPYVTLYQLGNALRHGDVQTLTDDVEWDAVREGLKEDIADQILPKPAEASLDGLGSLAPFGSGFATGIADNMVDQAVTPANLATGRDAMHVGENDSGQAPAWAWFSSLTRFDASFQLPTGSANPEPVRLELELVKTGWLPQWRVTRVWVPMPVLHQLQAHTT